LLLSSFSVPSEKRQRIRENRAKKAQAEAAKMRRGKTRKRAIYIAIGVVIAVIGVYFISRGSSSTSAAPKTAATSTTATTAAAKGIAPVCPPAAGSATREIAFTKAPPMCINTSASYTAIVKTDVGTFDIALDTKAAPITANNFVFLARYHYYDGIIFHRVIPGFVVQGGDPTGTGSGGPGYTIPDELPKAGAYKLGSVAMANTGQPNTGGSQFFIVVGTQGEKLPPSYSLFGQVTSGMSVVQKIAADGGAAPNGTPKVVHKMISVTIQGP